MITGIDLFGRMAISPNEKDILKAANQTADDMFKNRFDEHLSKNWDMDVKDVKIDHVEKCVVDAIKMLRNEGRDYAKRV